MNASILSLNVFGDADTKVEFTKSFTASNKKVMGRKLVSWQRPVRGSFVLEGWAPGTVTGLALSAKWKSVLRLFEKGLAWAAQ